MTRQEWLTVISVAGAALAMAAGAIGAALGESRIVGFMVPMPLMALDVLIGLLQAYIFAILATVYVGAAMRAGES